MNYKFYDFTDPSQRMVGLEELSKIEVEGVYLVTLYLSEIKDATIQKIKNELSLIERVKSKLTRKMVKEALTTILSYLQRNKNQKSIVLFANESELTVAKIPDHISRDDYICARKYDLEPLGSYSELKWGMIVMDTVEATVGILQNGKVTPVKNFQFYIQKKISAGGQSAQRFEQTRLNSINHMINELSEGVNGLFEKENIQKLLLGGINPTVTKFYTQNILSPHLKGILQPPIPVAYTDNSGLTELLKKCFKSYQVELKNYILEEQNYKKIIMGLAKGTMKPLAQYEYQTLIHPPNLILVKGRPYPELFCEDCKMYGRDLACDHSKIPIKSLEGVNFLGLGADSQFIWEKYKGLISTQSPN